MTLLFGLQLDDLSAPRPALEGGIHYAGPKTLLRLLENYLGLPGDNENIEYLRIEQYRQAILKALQKPDTTPFYRNAFHADQFATATDLLARRDELLLAGWDFQATAETPARLAEIAAIEQVFHPEQNNGDEAPLLLSPGFADRHKRVLETLDDRPHPFTEIKLVEPLELLPCFLKIVFSKLSNTAGKPAITVLPVISEKINTASDLGIFSQKIAAGQEGKTAGKPKTTLQNDGSLLVVRARRANEAAAWLAQLLRLNPVAFEEHVCLIPEKNRLLDSAMMREGMPSLGIESASLARPTLQILKLAPVFLWEPINPFKILEFVSLAVKPLPDDLATLIANQVAQSPGIQGEGWYAMINNYFDDLAARENEAPPADLFTAANRQRLSAKEQRRQYDFWFERRRYDMDKTAPKRDVHEVFEYLKLWALKAFEDSGGKNHSLLVLSGQSKRIVELLQALPETELSYLELERIVRTVYEPAPVVFQPEEAGRLPFVSHPGAFTGEVTGVVWWNFTQTEQPHFFSRWYGDERAFLATGDVFPDTPQQENARMLWQRTRPVLMAKRRLLLVVPDSIDGKEVAPHPLFGDLQAAFCNLDAIVFHVDSEKGMAPWQRHFTLPDRLPLATRQLGKPRPFLNVRNLDRPGRDYETLTSLESLFYYPYQWVFKYKIRLNKSSILSIVKDNTLMGNLAHRVFEKLLKENIRQFDKPTLERWVENETRRLLAREGAVLLMYGREPERIAFVNRLKYAAWSLVSHIRDNGWAVKQTEMPLEGIFPPGETSVPLAATPVKGIADLVLERGEECTIVDIKWRGASRRESILRNEEDLQLVLYAHLLSPAGTWPHTAYFIIENGKLIARNNAAFKGITALAPGSDHAEINERILSRMAATWQWRMEQLSEGIVEIRCRHTLSEIEETYGDSADGKRMMDILEMKGEDAAFDDYRTLINLVE